MASKHVCHLLTDLEATQKNDAKYIM